MGVFWLRRDRKDKKVQWVMPYHHSQLNDKTTQAANTIDLFAGDSEIFAPVAVAA